jgi:hypothetical protein
VQPRESIDRRRAVVGDAEARQVAGDIHLPHGWLT